MRLQLVYILLVTLLSSVAHAQPADSETQVTSDVLVYVDTDNVSVVSPQLAVRHALDEDGGEVSARVVLDAITAASVDVVSNATYRFSEQRVEVNLGVAKAIEEWVPGFSYRLSRESDYVSHGFSGGISTDFAGGDSNLAFRYSLALDRVGLADTPRSAFSESLDSHSAELGFTQVVDPNTLIRAVYTLTYQSGYMEKPYRSVPLFLENELQQLQNNGTELNLQNFELYRLASKPAEEVPDTRLRHAAAVRGLRFVEAIDASVRLDYRLYGDSWRLFAHTIEAALVKNVSRGWQLSSWLRLHYQGGADFWRREYTVNDVDSLPTLRTTDRSLSPYWQSTVGIRGEYSWSTWKTYWQVAGMYSSFLDHLYIDSRIAIISQGGLRWVF